MNYKKCPKCNSANAIRIKYGYPNEQTLLLAEEGKIILGGCCYTPQSSPEYYCKDCENRWSRRDAYEQAYKQIKMLKASVGIVISGFYNVEIDFQTRKIIWMYSETDVENYYEKTMSQTSFQCFFDKLMMIDLLSWKSEYIDQDVYNGTLWTLEIIRDSRNTKKFGDNKFLDGWDEFCLLISRISGKKFS